MRLWAVHRRIVLTNKKKIWENWIFAVKKYSNKNAQAHERNMQSWIFYQVWFASVFARRRNALFCQIISYLWNEIQVFKKLKRLEWKRTGARKKTCRPDFFVNCVISMRVCAVQNCMILLNKICIFAKWNHSFYESWKIGMETHRRTKKTCSHEFFFIKCVFHAFLRHAGTHDFAQ